MNTYKQYRDSTDAVTNPDELRARLRSDGYVHLRGLLDRSQVLRAATDLAGVLVAEGFAKPPKDPSTLLEEGLALRRYVDGNSAEYFDLYRKMYRSNRMHFLLRDSAVPSLIAQIYGAETVQQPMPILRLVFPSNEGVTPGTVLHQDYPGNQGSERSLTVWCPFGDYPPEAGTLVVAEGRHREGVFDHGISKTGRFEIQEDMARDERVGAVLAGDIIMFTAFTPHRALSNRSNKFRMSADYRFQPIDDPVSDLNFSDHCQIVRQEWAEIYEAGDFPHEHRFYWKRLDLNYHRHSNSHFAEQNKKAMQLAKEGHEGALAFITTIATSQFDVHTRELARSILRRHSSYSSTLEEL